MVGEWGNSGAVKYDSTEFDDRSVGPGRSGERRGDNVGVPSINGEFLVSKKEESLCRFGCDRCDDDEGAVKIGRGNCIGSSPKAFESSDISIRAERRFCFR